VISIVFGFFGTPCIYTKLFKNYFIKLLKLSKHTFEKTRSSQLKSIAIKIIFREHPHSSSEQVHYHPPPTYWYLYRLRQISFHQILASFLHPSSLAIFLSLRVNLIEHSASVIHSDQMTDNMLYRSCLCALAF
jgi:hypothetical protein